MEKWENEIVLMNYMLDVLRKFDSTETLMDFGKYRLDMRGKRGVKLYSSTGTVLAWICKESQISTDASSVFSDTQGLYIYLPKFDTKIDIFGDPEFRMGAVQKDPIHDWVYEQEGDMSGEVFQLETIHRTVDTEAIVLYSHYLKYISGHAGIYSRATLWNKEGTDAIDYEYLFSRISEIV